VPPCEFLPSEYQNAEKRYETSKSGKHDEGVVPSRCDIVHVSFALPSFGQPKDMADPQIASSVIFSGVQMHSRSLVS
jgi:hypothetical protein